MLNPWETSWPDAAEARHHGEPVEAWWWWGSSTDRTVGLFVGLELRGDRFDYWAGLVREGQPYLYIEELNGTDLRAGLEIKPAQMWADHGCDVPFRQWSIGNEAHAVLLDDPLEAWRRAYGTLVPVTFDVEWYATAAPSAVDPRDIASASADASTSGYRQLGEVDCRIELVDGFVEFVGPSERVHVWGGAYLPSSFAMPIDTAGLRAPYRRSDSILVDQVLTDRWWIAAHGRNP
jgi:hypothetical protein